ncbi:MAG: hypothetical protein WD768_18890 [Phycisphaeraceae bacterium]
MASQVIQSVWVPLAILGYLLITCMLNALTSVRRRTLDVHDRVRECMELRRAYLAAKAEEEE